MTFAPGAYCESRSSFWLYVDLRKVVLLLQHIVLANERFGVCQARQECPFYGARAGRSAKATSRLGQECPSYIESRAGVPKLRRDSGRKLRSRRFALVDYLERDIALAILVTLHVVNGQLQFVTAGCDGLRHVDAVSDEVVASLIAADVGVRR